MLENSSNFRNDSLLASYAACASVKLTVMKWPNLLSVTIVRNKWAGEHAANGNNIVIKGLLNCLPKYFIFIWVCGVGRADDIQWIGFTYQPKVFFNHDNKFARTNLLHRPFVWQAAPRAKTVPTELIVCLRYIAVSAQTIDLQSTN